MRIPVIPVVVLLVLAGGAVAFFTLSGSTGRSLGVPVTAPLVDVEGVETEVAIAPDGLRYALVASGDLWFVDLGDDRRRKLAEGTDPASAPAWTGDGERITFTRGPDTMAVDPDDGIEVLHLADARHLTWSTTNQMAFVRDRALWIAAREGGEARELVPADPRPDVTIRSPRFSPSGNQIAFVKTRLDLFGEVWRVEIDTGNAFPIVADRRSENPASADWVGDDNHLVYLTDRSGGLAVWYVDLEASTLLPVTPPLMGRAPAPLGIDVYGTRIVLPRYTADADIQTSTGRRLIAGPRSEMEPAVAADGRKIAYTVENEGAFEIWVTDMETSDSRSLGLGRHPRFAPSGNEIVYTRTGLDGNRDIWKADVRTGFQEPLTDDDEIDDVPDWSPDGRTIVFASTREGQFALWAIPSTGGRRQRLNDGGYAPRFSPDGARIAYWHDGAVWTAEADGTNPVRMAPAGNPAPPAWGPAGPAFFDDGRIRVEEGEGVAMSMWPEFDHYGDGVWLVSALDIEAAGLWSVDLTFTDEYE